MLETTEREFSGFLYKNTQLVEKPQHFPSLIAKKSLVVTQNTIALRAIAYRKHGRHWIYIGVMPSQL